MRVIACMACMTSVKERNIENDKNDGMKENETKRNDYNKADGVNRQKDQTTGMGNRGL